MTHKSNVCLRMQSGRTAAQVADSGCQMGHLGGLRWQVQRLRGQGVNQEVADSDALPLSALLCRLLLLRGDGRALTPLLPLPCFLARLARLRWRQTPHRSTCTMASSVPPCSMDASRTASVFTAPGLSNIDSPKAGSWEDGRSRRHLRGRTWLSRCWLAACGRAGACERAACGEQRRLERSALAGGCWVHWGRAGPAVTPAPPRSQIGCHPALAHSLPHNQGVCTSQQYIIDRFTKKRGRMQDAGWGVDLRGAHGAGGYRTHDDVIARARQRQRSSRRLHRHARSVRLGSVAAPTCLPCKW